MRPWHLASLLVSLLAGGWALAQPGPAELKAAQEEARQALERSRQLEAEAEKATSEAERTRAATEALAARIQASEAEITAAETRLSLADAQLRAQRARLAERQGPLVRLLGALQSFGRRPPALALVQPGSLDDAVRVRAVLAAALPRIRERTAALRGDIDRTRAIRGEQEAARETLVASRGELSQRREALAELEAQQRARSESLTAVALRASDRALALNEEARRVERVTTDRAFQERLAADLAQLPPPVIRPGGQGGTGPQGPSFLLPADGRVLAGVGELNGAGVHARGIALAVAAQAPVRAPAEGRIIYAGRFRSYDLVLIIDHGEGWTSVITDLASVDVRTGQGVSRGDIIGRAGGGEEPRVTVELRHQGRPVPITALLAS